MCMCYITLLCAMVWGLFCITVDCAWLRGWSWHDCLSTKTVISTIYEPNNPTWCTGSILLKTCSWTLYLLLLAICDHSEVFCFLPFTQYLYTDVVCSSAGCHGYISIHVVCVALLEAMVIVYYTQMLTLLGAISMKRSYYTWPPWYVLCKY